jgi:bifunctional non-homologous end joining protein LigD
MPIVLPDFIPPMLPEYAKQLPEGEDWVAEIKFDGFRIQAQAFNGQVRLLTREGKDWTTRFRLVANELVKIKGRYVFDGELVVFNDDRTTSLRDLQNYYQNAHRLTFVAFDLLHEGKKSLLKSSWDERRERLEEACPVNNIMLPSPRLEGTACELLQRAHAHNLEGIVFKKKKSLYVSGKSQDWLKAKCVLEQDMVVAGFTLRGKHIGSLLVGVYERGKLYYVTAVSVGIGEKDVKVLEEKIIKDVGIIESSCFINAPKNLKESYWLNPKLVAKIRYQSWPEDGAMRSPVYMGLRYDINQKKVQRDREIRLLASSAQLGLKR